MESNRKTALITGATSGIGYELTKLFAKDGYNLVLIARTEDDLNRVSQQMSEEFGSAVTIIPKNLSQPGAASEIYQETKNKGIEINILVNDAGIGQRGFFWDIDFEKYIEIINLNIIAVTQLTHLYLKDMRARNEGRILNLASIAAYQPTPMLAVYAATKAYVLSLGDALINELQDTNITLTTLIPGPTETDFFNKADMENTVAASKADNAEEVAKEGYEALMKGENHAVGTIKTGVQAAMSTVMPNELVSKAARKYMEEKK
jgi:uncharacterized protein